MDSKHSCGHITQYTNRQTYRTAKKSPLTSLIPPPGQTPANSPSPPARAGAVTSEWVEYRRPNFRFFESSRALVLVAQYLKPGRRILRYEKDSARSGSRLLLRSPFYGAGAGSSRGASAPSPPPSSPPPQPSTSQSVTHRDSRCPTLAAFVSSTRNVRAGAPCQPSLYGRLTPILPLLIPSCFPQTSKLRTQSCMVRSACNN